MTETHAIRLPALRLRLPSGRDLYAFGIDGKLISTFATVSRIARNGEGHVRGYQRPEVLSHIAEIRAYLESENAMIPNAVVIAFAEALEFAPTPVAAASDGGAAVTAGLLSLPRRLGVADADKPGFVVDGQQRLAAIREAAVERFPIFAIAFVARDVSEQTEQFILVNSTKPLPKGLIYELLPETTAVLPTLLRRRRLPAAIAERLNQDADSPLRGMITTPTTPSGVMKDNSVLRMIENSLSDGVLYRYRQAWSDLESVSPAVLSVVKNFWHAVREIFPTAWGLPPKRSRLMHGAGVVSLGFVMDAVADRHRERVPVPMDLFESELVPLKDACRWTEGYWDFGPGQQRRWNELQNTSRDIQLLSNYLLVQYRQRPRGGAGRDATE